MNETFENTHDIPEDFESCEFIFKDVLPKRSLSLAAFQSLLEIPFLGRRFASQITKRFKGASTANILPGFKCLYGNFIAGNNVALHNTFCVDYAPITLYGCAKVFLRNILIKSTCDLKDFTTVIAKSFVIERNIWIASGCIIPGDMRIGEHSVVAVGSVLTANHPV